MPTFSSLFQYLFSILVFGAFLSIFASPAAAEFTFEQYEVVIGSAERQTVLTGFLLGGAVADLAVVNIDENGDRRLRLYAFRRQHLGAAIRCNIASPSVVRGCGQYRRTRPLDCVRERSPELVRSRDRRRNTILVAATSNFNPPRSGEIPHVDVTRDVNGDERDDLVVPDVDGFWVFVQMSDGAFADPVQIGTSTDMSRIYGADGYRYNPWGQSRVHEMDYNRDGLSDLVFWNEDHFEVHLQDEHGLFAPAAKTFTTDVAFDSDDLSSLATGDMTGRVLHSLSDMNGDGAADLVVFLLEGRSISSKRSAFDVHFGTPTADGGTAFAPEVGATFQSGGSIQLGMDRHDFDRDDQVDLMLTTIDIDFLEGSLWKSIKGFMGDDIRLDLEFYHMEGGRYPDTPDAIRRIALDGVPSHREPGSVSTGHRASRGDARTPQDAKELAACVQLDFAHRGCDRRRPLRPAHRAAPETPGRLCRRTVAGPVLPAASRRCDRRAQRRGIHSGWWTSTRTARQDILMHHPFTLRDAHGARRLPPGTEPHRVTVLIAR